MRSTAPISSASRGECRENTPDQPGEFSAHSRVQELPQSYANRDCGDDQEQGNIACRNQRHMRRADSEQQVMDAPPRQMPRSRRHPQHQHQLEAEGERSMEVGREEFIDVIELPGVGPQITGDVRVQMPAVRIDQTGHGRRQRRQAAGDGVFPDREDGDQQNAEEESGMQIGPQRRERRQQPEPARVVMLQDPEKDHR